MKFPHINIYKCAIFVALAGCLFSAVPLRGSDLSWGRTAQILRVVAASSRTKNRIACTDAEVAYELKSLGMKIDPMAKVAWAASEQDLKALIEDGHLVVCGEPAFLAKGASIALTQVRGRPAIYVSMGNVRASKMTLKGSFLNLNKNEPLKDQCDLFLSW